MIKYIGSQKKKTIYISGNSSIILASSSDLDKGVYRIYEVNSPEDNISVTWNGTSFDLKSFPDSKFVGQNLPDFSNKLCFFIDSSYLKIYNRYSNTLPPKILITWLEN